MGFSLEKFESLAYQHIHEEGMRELLALLQSLDEHYGGVGPDFYASPLGSVSQEDLDLHIWTRAASAASALLSDKNLLIAKEWRPQILTLHRWFSALFAATPFRNADHVLRGLNTSDDKSDLLCLNVEVQHLLKFALLYTAESEVPVDLDVLWEADKQLAASLTLVLVTSRFLGSPSAHTKRELILPWLSKRLDEIDDIEQLPQGVLHDLYMHCSYADQTEKHDIKKPINTLIRRKLQQLGLNSVAFSACDVQERVDIEKPVLLVVIEWFGKGHSIYRTHSRTLEAARGIFHVVGMGYPSCVDEVTRHVFDEFIELNQSFSLIDQLQQIRATANSSKAAILYMPSVGMFPLTMWLSNLRLAPLQIMALGHPATTHSDAIDFVVVEEDYVGDARCFSERLLQLPRDGMPYRPSAEPWRLTMKTVDASSEVVQIAVCATIMKINPGFLSACHMIVQGSKEKVHFHFLLGQNHGLVRPNVEHVIRRFLGHHVTIYPHQAYEPYMGVISRCDMFINPFPFGNTNGISDTVTAGLVGVCKTGPEVHEHIDQGIFERLGFPSWLIADTVDAYIAAAIRLVENHAERKYLRETLAGPEKVQTLFKGRPEVMSQRFQEALRKMRQG